MTIFDKLLYFFFLVYLLINIFFTFKMIKWISQPNKPAKVEIKYIK